MPETKKISAEAKRLNIVYMDCKKAKTASNTTELAAILEVDQSAISRMLNGVYPLNYTVAKNVCMKLGYSPQWFFTGKGDMKVSDKDVKLITEIKTLRAEINILEQALKRMEARMKAYEEKQPVP
jgi:plasmid maintenance system antidote protein VapI